MTEYSKEYATVLIYNDHRSIEPKYVSLNQRIAQEERHLKKMTRLVSFLVAALMILTLVACGAAGTTTAATTAKAGGSTTAATTAAGKKIVVGFSQIGAESEWRTAMTQNVKDAMEKAGFDLKYSDGQQKQENQIKALRSFIQQQVDVIILAPVVATGWDAVLKEAKDAKIPVIVANRGLSLASGNAEDYYVTFLGPDNTLAGKLCFDFVYSRMKDKTGDVNIVELQGTVGASTATERKKGFGDAQAKYPNFKTIASQSGDYTRAKGKEVMEAILKSTKAAGQKIDVLWSANDDMAIGASQAIEEAGLKPGKDILIVSVDGVRGAFEAMVAGKHNATAENPIDYGTPLLDLIKKIAAGQSASIPKRMVMEYKIWDDTQAAKELPNRKY